MPINMLQTEIVFNKESNCQTSGYKNFCIREYVAAVRERDPATCWPFGSICEFKDLNTQDVAPESLSLSKLKITEDTNAHELSKVQNSKGKEVIFEAPTAFEVGVSKNNEAGSKTVTAFELEWTKENNTDSEIATAKALLEISKGNKTQLETAATEFELEIPKGKKTQSENASAFELEWTKEIDTGYESETATEIITSKELNGGMDENMSDGGTELVNLSESENEEIVKGYGGTKTEIVVISDDDDANSGKTLKPTKKRKCRALSELLRDLAGPDIESTLHFADKVDENTDESDEDFTIDDYDDEDDSDDDTLWMLLKKRKAVKITSRSNRSRNYKKKKTCAPKPKPSNRGPKARTKRVKLHPHPHPHDNFATRKLADAVEAEVALPAIRKRCGSYDMRNGTGRTVVGQPVAGVGGSKDPGPVVTGTPGTRWTLVCLLNRNPTDFTIVGPGNKYMRRF